MLTPTNNYGFTHTDGTIKISSFVGPGQAGTIGGWFGTQSNHPLHFYTNNGAASMTVTTDGNVGIGTTNPFSKLAVQTPVQSYGFTHTDGTVIVGSYTGLGSGQFGTRTNHPLHFFTNDSSPRMTLDTLGNVGIGSFAAPVRLFVSGGPAWTSNGWQGSLGFQNATAIG